MCVCVCVYDSFETSKKKNKIKTKRNVTESILSKFNLSQFAKHGIILKLNDKYVLPPNEDVSLLLEKGDIIKKKIKKIKIK